MSPVTQIQTESFKFFRNNFNFDFNLMLKLEYEDEHT